jgi:glycosyltransferase involved in cell wall biosynthesis
VPGFNGGDYLERCAPSLLEQSIRPDAYEVIYVNDGWTDDSEERLARVTAQNPQARYLTQPNSGRPGKPRNVGIAAS